MGFENRSLTSLSTRETFKVSGGKKETVKEKISRVMFWLK